MYFVLFDKIKLKSYDYCYEQSVFDLDKIL